jgi:membrane-associated phospholipid phosphatase
VGRVRCSVLVLVWQLLALASASAQRQPSHDIRWWEATIVLGSIGAVSLADHRVDNWVQDHRSARSDAVAHVFRYGGEPELVFGIPAGILAAGFISGNKNLQRSGGRVLATVITAGITTAGIKVLVGRVRPDATGDPYVFKPFTQNDAFPSGHTTMAFALATALSAEIDRPWATAVLYAGASGTAWSRLNDQKHWLSDVLAGATVGITAGNVIEGRWRIFGLGPPRLLVDPHAARLEWHAVF